MVDPHMNNDPIEKRFPRAFQFGLRTLFVATLICAAIASLVATMNIPPVIGWIVTFLAISYVLYIILRVPGLLRRHRVVKKHLDKARVDILIQAEDTRKTPSDRERVNAEQQSE